jgi:hypothetical protein
MTYPSRKRNTAPLRHDLYLTKQCFTQARIKTNHQNVPNLWRMPTTWTFEHHGKGTLTASIVIWTIHEVGARLYGPTKWMTIYIDNQYIIVDVTTLALGSRLKQGVAKLRAKRETRESHHMLPGVQRVWGNEPSPSQVNSHYGNWNPKWTLKSSERDCKGQNPLVGRVFYIIGKLLKRKCLKWAMQAHLDIWNTSYDQKKGQESNWQFDSWPLKVRNQPDFFACKQRATYRWKVLNKGYNFVSDLIKIGVSTRSYGPPKLQ